VDKDWFTLQGDCRGLKGKSGDWQRLNENLAKKAQQELRNIHGQIGAGEFLAGNMGGGTLEKRTA
jgi:hypothetical protein